MIDLEYIKSFYPNPIANNNAYNKHLLKEYVELMALDFIYNSKYAPKMSFIGGTNLRLIKGLDRWSEDLDFDCKDLSKEEFLQLTEALTNYLVKNGINAIIRDRENPKLKAYRRNIYFPEMLFELGLTGHREERFLLKVEAQDQNIEYMPVTTLVRKCGFFINVLTPPDDVLMSMKLSALLSRAKGRDFYDVMFLSQLTKPNFYFLEAKHGIKDNKSLKIALHDVITHTDLETKTKDFMHLLLNSTAASRILSFPQFIDTLT